MMYLSTAIVHEMASDLRVWFGDNTVAPQSANECREAARRLVDLFASKSGVIDNNDIITADTVSCGVLQYSSSGPVLEWFYSPADAVALAALVRAGSVEVEPVVGSYYEAQSSPTPTQLFDDGAPMWLPARFHLVTDPDIAQLDFRHEEWFPYSWAFDEDN